MSLSTTRFITALSVARSLSLSTLHSLLSLQSSLHSLGPDADEPQGIHSGHRSLSDSAAHQPATGQQRSHPHQHPPLSPVRVADSGRLLRFSASLSVTQPRPGPSPAALLPTRSLVSSVSPCKDVLLLLLSFLSPLLPVLFLCMNISLSLPALFLCRPPPLPPPLDCCLYTLCSLCTFTLLPPPLSSLIERAAVRMIPSPLPSSSSLFYLSSPHPTH
jgi:hypothetical protein